MDEGQRVTYDGVPFTGEVVEGALDDPTSLETYRDGWLNGPWRLWYLDGSPKAQGEFVHGGLVGEVLAWHANGRLESRRLFTETSREVAGYAWDEDGRETRSWTAGSGAGAAGVAPQRSMQ